MGYLYDELRNYKDLKILSTYAHWYKFELLKEDFMQKYNEIQYLSTFRLDENNNPMMTCNDVVKFEELKRDYEKLIIVLFSSSFEDYIPHLDIEALQNMEGMLNSPILIECNQISLSYIPYPFEEMPANKIFNEMRTRAIKLGVPRKNNFEKSIYSKFYDLTYAYSNFMLGNFEMRYDVDVLSTEYKHYLDDMSTLKCSFVDEKKYNNFKKAYKDYAYELFIKGELKNLDDLELKIISSPMYADLREDYEKRNGIYSKNSDHMPYLNGLPYLLQFGIDFEIFFDADYHFDTTNNCFALQKFNHRLYEKPTERGFYKDGHYYWDATWSILQTAKYCLDKFTSENQISNKFKYILNSQEFELYKTIDNYWNTPFDETTNRYKTISANPRNKFMSYMNINKEKFEKLLTSNDYNTLQKYYSDFIRYNYTNSNSKSISIKAMDLPYIYDMSKYSKFYEKPSFKTSVLSLFDKIKKTNHLEDPLFDTFRFFRRTCASIQKNNSQLNSLDNQSLNK